MLAKSQANARDQQENEAKKQNHVTAVNEALGPTPLPMPTAKPVDEDLYNISPPLVDEDLYEISPLFRKTKKVSFLY